MSDKVIELAKSFYDTKKNDLTLTRDKSAWRSRLAAHSPKNWESVGYDPKMLFQQGVFADKDTFTVFYRTVFELMLADDVTHIPEHLQDCTIVTDIIKGVRWVKEGGGVKPYNYDTWKDQVPKDVYDIMFSEQENAIVAFDPYKNLSWEGHIRTSTGKEEFTHYNLYVKPDWRFEPKKTEFPLCEEYVRPFLEHLFPKAEERIRVIHWILGVTKARRNDLLLLIGRPGNGKGTLKDMVSGLVGQENQIIAATDFAEDKFNGEIAYKQFIRADEFKVKGKRKENLKKFSNDDITIERKGGDPIPMPNFCSFAIANNNDDSVDVVYDDRRFFIPELTDKNLTSVWPEIEVYKFKFEVIPSLDFQCEFPEWLEKECAESGIEYTGNIPYRTDRFYELVEKSKPKWWREFKNILTLQTECTLEQVRSLTKQRQVTDLKIKEMLEKETEEREAVEKERLGLGREPGKYLPFIIATPVFEAGIGVKYVSHVYEGDSSSRLDEDLSDDISETFV